MKAQNFDKFVKGYKRLKFKFLGFTLREHLPRESTFDWPYLLRIRLKTLLGLPLNYFDLRPSLTPEGKKTADMALLTYSIRKRDRGAENVSGSTKLRYHLCKLRYMPELSYIHQHIGKPEADNYMLRWGYLLDINPSFIELIEGTDNQSAWYALENIR